MTTKHVLVVEDEKKIAQLISDYLQKAGYKIDSLERGDRVVPYIRKDMPDLILLDIMLPGIDGMAVCREIRKFSDVPIIMITSRVGDKHRARAIELGVNDYLGKPYQDSQLLDAIRRQLDEKGIHLP